MLYQQQEAQAGTVRNRQAGGLAGIKGSEFRWETDKQVSILEDGKRTDRLQDKRPSGRQVEEGQVGREKARYRQRVRDTGR